MHSLAITQAWLNHRVTPSLEFDKSAVISHSIYQS